MIYDLARRTAICLALVALFGIAKGFYDVGESYIDFSAIGIVKGAAVLFATALAVAALATARELGWPQDRGGFR